MIFVFDHITEKVYNATGTTLIDYFNPEEDMSGFEDVLVSY